MRKAIFSLLALFLVSSYSYPYPAEDVYNLTGNDYFPEVKRLLGSAKKSIYISMYIASFDPGYPKRLSNQLLQELVRANKRGVAVRVILDQGRVSSMGQYNDMAYFYLKNAGVSVEYDVPFTKLHDKLIIIDEYITIIGSHNWTKSALERNRETSVVIQSSELANKLIEWIKTVQISPRREPQKHFSDKEIFIPYDFLTNPNVGSRLLYSHDTNAFILYLLLITKWKNEEIYLDHRDTLKSLNITWNNTNSVIRLLEKLSEKYHLIKTKRAGRGVTLVNLLDYNSRNNSLIIKPEKSFRVPYKFWEFEWAKRLLMTAQYMYFINIVETNKSSDIHGRWSRSQKELKKDYRIGLSTISSGIMELSHYELLSVEYGNLPYSLKDLTAPEYRLLPLYSWEWHEEQIAKLKELYGAEKIEKARNWAKVTLDENNLDVIEKLVNYADQYGDLIVQYAVDKVAQRRIANQKRNFLYLEGIILKQARDRQEEKEETED